MNQIKCPHCGKEFTIDESSYLDIVKQIKDKEFQKDLHERLEALKIASEKDIELAKNKVKTELDRKSTRLNSSHL